MGAGGADSEDFSAPAGQQHRLVADLTDKHRAIGEIIFGNALRQIRLVLVRLCHLILLAAYVAASTLSRRSAQRLPRCDGVVVRLSRAP
jgi:hypothetical protein